MPIYENIRKYAKKKKLTLNEVEKQADVGIGSISRWKTIKPNLESLEKVAKVLDVKVAKLIE